MDYVALIAALVPTLPALAAWYSSRKAHVAATTAVSKADVAATSAQKAEENTNGKLNAQFVDVHTELAELKALLTAHIAGHMQ